MSYFNKVIKNYSIIVALFCFSNLIYGMEERQDEVQFYGPCGIICDTYTTGPTDDSPISYQSYSSRIFSPTDRAMYASLLSINDESDIEKLDISSDIKEALYTFYAEINKDDGISYKRALFNILERYKRKPLKAMHGRYRPYPAERDIFVGTAHRERDEAAEYLEEVNDCIQNSHHEKRLEFNQVVINHILSHATTSSIFKAVQRLDVCFKVLDSLLTMMYNDLIIETRHELYKQFAAIKSEVDDKCIKNFAAMSNYIQNYSQRHNAEHKQGNYLPFYIAQTTKKLTKALNAIVRSNYKPQFNQVTRVIDNIRCSCC